MDFLLLSWMLLFIYSSKKQQIWPDLINYYHLVYCKLCVTYTLLKIDNYITLLYIFCGYCIYTFQILAIYQFLVFSGRCWNVFQIPIVYFRRHLVNERNREELDEVSNRRLTSMALDVARGLSYLAELKYVHRDVACRNCLVNSSRVVKLADFGMTRPMYENDYYRFSRKGK